jgi:hypothetical protein
MTYVLIVWLIYSVGNAPPVVVGLYDSQKACETAGDRWEQVQHGDGQHHACLPQREVSK